MADDYKPDAVLVKLGDGNWLPFEHEGMLKLNVSTLLDALADSRVFAVKLSGVALDECIVNVCVSANKKKPSTEDETRAGEAGKLEGAATLGDIVTDMDTAGRPYLYIRVKLPAVGELHT